VAGEKFARTLQVSSEPDGASETLTDVDGLAGWVEIVHHVKEITRLKKCTGVLQDRCARSSCAPTPTSPRKCSSRDCTSTPEPSGALVGVFARLRVLRKTCRSTPSPPSSTS
jgi:hypothetical protein